MVRVWWVWMIGVWGMWLCLAADAGAVDEGVRNVGFVMQGQKVLVNYDLEGKGVYTVSLRLLGDGGSRLAAMPRAVSGDVGAEVRPGKGKKIVWEALKDVKSLEGNDFVFEVKAARPGGSSKWVWIGGAGIAGGAVAGAAVLSGGGDKKGSIAIDVPDPEE